MRTPREEILRALGILFQEGEVVELRIPSPFISPKRPISGYFNDFNKLADNAERWSGRAEAVYITLNPINPALLARSANKVKSSIPATSDSDVLRRRWFPIDIDPDRPSGVSSTDEEHSLAIERARQIREFLSSRGWPAPILADSGNGAHLLYRIDLPNDEESKRLIERCLKVIEARFSDDKVKIDTTVFNAGRIWKLYGTMVCKGENLPDRPHRMARILEVPREIKTVTRDLLEELARLLPVSSSETEHTFKGDIEEVLEKLGIGIKKVKSWQGAKLIELKECPFNPAHNRGEAFVIQFPDGGVHFRCFHNSCSDKGWREFSEKTGLKLLKGSSKRKGKGKGEREDYKIAKYLLEKYRWITMEDTEEVFMYDPSRGCYVPGESRIKAFVQEYCSNNGVIPSNHMVNEVIGHIRRSTYVPRYEINKHIELINVKNGVLNLLTGELIPHSPDLYFTIQIPVEYNPEADCLAIKKFFSEVLYPDDIPVIEEIFGYCLYRRYHIQKAFLFVGSGANGKSVMINLLREFLGRDNVSGVTLQSLLTNRFALADLYGKLANLFADLPYEVLEATGIFKALTGGDPVQAEKKYKNPFTFTNYAKLIFSANDVPPTTDKTYAFFRRWVIIEFPNRFEGDRADKNLIFKLTTPDELSGLLNVALSGLRRLLDQGDFSYSRSVEAVREEYELRANPVRFFVERCCELRDGYITTKNAFQAAYAKFAEMMGLRKLTSHKITNLLKMEYPIEDGVRKVDGVSQRVWVGIRVKPEEEWEI